MWQVIHLRDSFCDPGLIESILASALARCGKSVLHLDKYVVAPVIGLVRGYV